MACGSVADFAGEFTAGLHACSLSRTRSAERNGVTLGQCSGAGFWRAF